MLHGRCMMTGLMSYEIVNKKCKLFTNNLVFAQELFKRLPKDRLDWISEKVYDKLTTDENTTLEELTEIQDKINSLYGSQ